MRKETWDFKAWSRRYAFASKEQKVALWMEFEANATPAERFKHDFRSFIVWAIVIGGLIWLLWNPIMWFLRLAFSA